MPSNLTVATAIAIKHKTEAYQLHFRPFNMTDTKSTIQNEQRATQHNNHKRLPQNFNNLLPVIFSIVILHQHINRKKQCQGLDYQNIISQFMVAD